MCVRSYFWEESYAGAHSGLSCFWMRKSGTGHTAKCFVGEKLQLHTTLVGFAGSMAGEPPGYLPKLLSLEMIYIAETCVQINQQLAEFQPLLAKKYEIFQW